MPTPLKLLLTGDPGCGKTTAVRNLVERLRGEIPMTGFWTEEIRLGARRVGFRGVLVDGRTFVLAHVDHGGPLRVGPYGVNVEELDAVGVPSLDPQDDTKLVVLDEIGKMECFSSAFRAAVERRLSGPVPLVATVARHGIGFPKAVRRDERVELVTMSATSRASIVDDLHRRLARAGIASGPRIGRAAR